MHTEVLVWLVGRQVGERLRFPGHSVSDGGGGAIKAGHGAQLQRCACAGGGVRAFLDVQVHAGPGGEALDFAQLALGVGGGRVDQCQVISEAGDGNLAGEAAGRVTTLAVVKPTQQAVEKNIEDNRAEAVALDDAALDGDGG